MAIDESVLARQLRAVGSDDEKAPVPKVACKYCGAECRSRRDTCADCGNGWGVRRMTVKKLLAKRDEIDAELRRRRDEITELLGDKP